MQKRIIKTFDNIVVQVKTALESNNFLMNSVTKNSKNIFALKTDSDIIAQDSKINSLRFHELEEKDNIVDILLQFINIDRHVPCSRGDIDYAITLVDSPMIKVKEEF